ncbi:hypothetical protein EDL79_01300 [Ehrlichia ruminantium]|uniref:Uncharacterized protein n=1 Tax=Ehrlichia ruminantium TaxID=779 RepID=A0AAE6UJE0_EHRRU|nr:hypothetical protein [Ehrlichia ruminantium]QGR02316.1 hypothetical protein EDL81_01300 [Ehrlichia ruminantium]QGR03236.1 hypothetical protein EDL80_01300 [Ehrlichia ruminantium]QGR04161.1 hypothetical protein EDL79_01300 [Ehrlichia ruminantium]
MDDWKIVCFTIVLGIMFLALVIYLIVYIILYGEELTLLGTRLLDMVDSADTAIHGTQSCLANGTTYFFINGEEKSKQISSQLNDYQERGQDDLLVLKHLNYLKTSQRYNSHSQHAKMSRAMIGAAIESIIMQGTQVTPSMSLIHHTISYLYSPGYECLLINMINDVIQLKHKAMGYERLQYPLDISCQVLNVRYDTTLPNQLSIDVSLSKRIPMVNGVCCKRYSSRLFSTMNLLISPAENNDEVLEYSSKKGIRFSITKYDERGQVIHPKEIYIHCIPDFDHLPNIKQQVDRRGVVYTVANQVTHGERSPLLVSDVEGTSTGSGLYM